MRLHSGLPLKRRILFPRHPQLQHIQSLLENKVVSPNSAAFRLALYIAGKLLVVVAKAVSTKRLCAPALHSPGGGLASLLCGGGGVMGLAWFCSFLSSCFCSLCLTPTCPCLSFQRLLRTRLETPSRGTQDALCREPHLSCITLRHIHNS